MPRDAATRGNRAKLMDNVARYEVYVVVSETNLRVGYSLTTQLVQFRLVEPLNALVAFKGGCDH